MRTYRAAVLIALVVPLEVSSGEYSVLNGTIDAHVWPSVETRSDLPQYWRTLP
jgi:hypothetical protein